VTCTEIDTDRFNVKKLNEVYVKKQCQVKIRNRFAALENSEDGGDINGTWDSIREKIIFRPKRVQVIVNQSIVNRGSMRNVQNWLIKGSRLTIVFAGLK
jgi:hypothetical protein